MSDEIGAGPLDQAQALAHRLREEGYGAYADQLNDASAVPPSAEEATSEDGIGHALLEALRETCRTVLTAIEALDPKTQLLAEELRLEVDKRLGD